MGIRVKICGVTDVAGAAAAVDAGADCVGFVFAESERRVTITEAVDVAVTLPERIRTVAVLRHASTREIEQVRDGFRPDVIQCEPSDAVRAAIGPDVLFLPVFHDSPDLLERVAAYRSDFGDGLILLEGAGRGGRGTRADWDRAREAARRGPLALAGGLGPANVAEAIRHVRPWGVDVSSGVERSPGVKDPILVREFVENAVRRAETS